MSECVLITGGAGFIGSHLADELLRHGYRVRVLDNLSPQVHGEGRQRPAYLNPEIELIVGDIRDLAAVEKALEGVDAVYHFASMVGIGQSMYEIAEYTSVNSLGTAVLLQALIKHPVKRLVIASSVSIYGEGLYRSRSGKIYQDVQRNPQQLAHGHWELQSAEWEILIPIPTPESKTPALASIYALNKYEQERASLIFSEAYHVPTVALRFFNVYGTRQALSNPYTGVLAIFASRLLNNNAPLIFEDGCQQRDFVHVYDVAQACRLAMEAPHAAGKVFNVGSGHQYTIRSLAERMAEALGKNIAPEITGKYRIGDIRHCFADITQAREALGYRPRISFEEGVIELAEWLEGQVAYDRFSEATAELVARGLAK